MSEEEKRKHWCFLLVLMLALALWTSCGAESNETGDIDNARGLANFMEGHYGVTFLIESECDRIEIPGVQLSGTPYGGSPLQRLAGFYNYEQDVRTIDDAFSVYPPGYFQKFETKETPLGLRILLSNQIVFQDDERNALIAGTVIVQDRYYNLILRAGLFDWVTVHHELWHTMEMVILAQNPDAFLGWITLNPPGFQYSESYTTMDGWEKDKWFVREYSTTNEREDRATVIEAVFKYDDEWWTAHPGVKAKLDWMLEEMEPIFGDQVYFHESEILTDKHPRF